jgi:hypothetical protein
VLAHGGWDEGWPRNQDSELAARFLAGGQRIVCLPAMAARYIPRDSLSRLWRQYHGYGRYRAKTARRHPTSLRRSAVLPPLVVLDAAVAIVTAITGPRVVALVAAGAIGLYVAALLAAGFEARGRGLATAARVPLVLATMHLAHGVGFIVGSAIQGVPWRALARLVLGDRRGLARAYAGPIDAPSLGKAT